MNAERARFLLGEALPELGKAGSPALWKRADAILEAARRSKGIAARKRDLNAALDAEGSSHEQRARVVMLTALGRSTDQSPALSTLAADLVQLLTDEADEQFLASAIGQIEAGQGREVDWEALIDVAERAARVRLGPNVDRLEQQTWQGLYASRTANRPRRPRRGTPSARGDRPHPSARAARCRAWSGGGRSAARSARMACRRCARAWRTCSRAACRRSGRSWRAPSPPWPWRALRCRTRLRSIPSRRDRRR